MAIQRNNPYAAFNFLVELDGMAIGGFSEVSGLSHEIGVIEYREGGDRRNAVRKLPGLHKVGNITLKRGITGTLELYQWLKDVRDGNVSRRNLSIQLLPEDKSGAAMRWLLRDCFPVKLVHGPLNAKSNEVAVEELVLAVEAFEIE
ncbi:phage tail protein [Sandaracinobacteroides hominis]|uniref:phage tail protein n=1 Tax=Sandaracinobacteroides hominis TaxID=2780086 RepID=UPI0018F7C0B4|nr:phage tail protein [Sandaracinobacteroides hominis]